jgi:nitroimidazol reductase NimA-like FMN-containing flavoprotein (pyridoxamine 5'-phosphate oxidase superfamily)
MGTIDACTNMERLSRAECWKLLEQAPVGRLAVIVDGVPVVYPVNHMVEWDAIVIRSDPGSKLAGLTEGAPVSFEVDDLEPDGRRGWSVLVKGRARPMRDPAMVALAERHPPAIWTTNEKPHWIRIVPTQVTGRRIWRTAEDIAGRDRPGAVVLEPHVGPEWAEEGPTATP